MPDQAPVIVHPSPRILRQARERVGLSPDEAAGLVARIVESETGESFELSRVAAFETGVRSPALLEAEALARVYLVPFVSLFQTELPTPGVSDFRRTATGQARSMSYETLRRLDKYDSFYTAVRRIAEGIGLAQPPIPTRQVESIRTKDDIENLAATIRNSIAPSRRKHLDSQTDADAFAGWRSVVEEGGTFVFLLPMRVDECRGASRWEPPAPRTILVNAADHIPAQLFTLIHEYVHLVFTSEPDINLCDPSVESDTREEFLANRVAAAVLVPRDDLIEAVPPHVPSKSYAAWPSAARAVLKRRFNVSHAVIGIRLRELGIVKDAGYKIWKKPSGFIPRGRNDKVSTRHRRYLGEHAVALARTAVDSEAVSIGELAKILDLKVRDVEQAIL